MNKMNLLQSMNEGREWLHKLGTCTEKKEKSPKWWQKRFGAAICLVGISAVGIGCGSKMPNASLNATEGQTSDWVEKNHSESQENPTLAGKNHSESQESPTLTQNSSNAIQAENLTAQLNEYSCIDYAVSSMQPVWDFGQALFEQIMEEENPVLSPVSAYVALSMAGRGAEGDTKEEFQSLLASDMICLPDYLMNCYSGQTDSLQLNIANSVWIDERFLPEHDWLLEMKSFFDADVFQTTLSSEDAKNDINHWVSNKTNGLIENMIEEAFDEDVKVVLFDVLYFQAEWEYKFKKQATFERPFTLADGTKVDVDTMHLNEVFLNYIQGENFDGVILPYQDSNLAFMAIKATEGEDIRSVAKEISFEQVSSLIENASEECISLALPKFEVSFDEILNESLESLGLVKAFDSELADFSNLGSSKDGGNLFISLVRQKAVITVDEEGTEAAAVTEVVMIDEAAMESRQMMFNEPFLYIILDTENQTPLFVGIMDNPVKENGR